MACFSACIFVNTALSEQLNLPNTNTDYRKEGRERVWRVEEARTVMRGEEGERMRKKEKRGREGEKVRTGGEEVYGATKGVT